MNKEHENLCPLSYLYPLLADHFHLLIPAAEGIQMYLQALIFMEWSLKPLCIIVHPLSNSYSVNFRMAILMRNITLLKEHFYHNSKTYYYSPIHSIIIFTFSNVSLSISSSVVSDSLQFHGQQLVRLLCPRDSPGKSTGVGCHALFRGSSRPRDRTQLSCIAGGFFTI